MILLIYSANFQIIPLVEKLSHGYSEINFIILKKNRTFIFKQHIILFLWNVFKVFVWFFSKWSEFYFKKTFFKYKSL